MKKSYGFRVQVKEKAQEVGCGYCVSEKTCEIRDPKINKAKLGCEKFKHYIMEMK